MRPFAIEDVSSYVDRIQSYDRISLEEEVRLATVMDTGTPEERAAARERLICANLRLVIKIAHDFKRFGLGFADLVSEGNMGLMIAADKFRPGMGAKFSCYAAWWIKQSMRKALAWQSRLIRIPGKTAQVSINLNKARRKYEMEHGETPDAELSAELAGCPLSTVRMLDGAATEVLSMHDCVSADADESTTLEMMLTDTEDEACVKEERLSVLRSALSCLNDLDRRVLSGMHGLDGHRKDRNILAQETGLSPEAVDDRLAAVHARLRDMLA